MDRRTTRPRTKPQGNEVPSGSASVSAANGGGDDLIDPIEPDFPSSEGDIPVASLVVEEIKSNDAVTYKIGNVNGSELGENVVVQGPVPDVVPSVPEERIEEKREEKQEGANGNGKESEEVKNDVAVADSKPVDDVVQSNGVAGIDEPVVAETAATEENSVEETAQAAVDEKPQIEEKEKPQIEDKEKPQIEEKEKPKVNGGIAETSATSPPKKSRKARELSNLVSTLVGAETPIKDEPDAGDGPKSRSGRVLKLKTPSKDDEIGSPEKKRRREPKTPTKTGNGEPTAKTGNGEPTAKTGNGKPAAKTGNGEPTEREEKTPRVGRPRSTARVCTPSTRAESGPSGSVEVLKKVPEKRVVVFPFHQKIICSREDLLRIPVKIEEAEFFVGDLIWSKVTGYPYWPCMVTVDPLKGTYTELDEKSGEYTYHVQYFGDSATRSWTRPRGIFKFEGYDHYKSLEDPTPSTSASNTPSGKGGRGRSGKKGNPKYMIEGRYRKDWMAAVSEAELAMKMKGGKKERIESFTYIYEQSEKSDESSRKRRGGDSTPSNGASSKKRSKKTANSSPEDVYDFDEEFDGDADLEEVSKSPLRLMSLKKKGDFTVFVARERSNLKKSNPGLKESEIDRLLEKNWEFLPEDQKLKYVNRSGQSDSPAVCEGQTGAAPTPGLLKIKLNKTVKPRTPACLIARKPRKSATPLKAAVELETGSGNLDILDEPLVIDDIIAPVAGKASTKKTPTRTPRRGSKVSTNSK